MRAHPGVHTASLQLRAPNCDAAGYWRAGDLLLQLQELAGEHADRLGAGFLALRARNLAWVLSRVQLHFDTQPHIGQQVYLSTWHGAMRHGVFSRYYVVCDEAGTPLVRGSSLWVVLDLHKRAMAAAGDIVLPPPPELPQPLPNPGRMSALQGRERLHLLRPSYDDIDINGHVNNTRYADWLCNLYPPQHFQTHGIAELALHFSKEVLPEQTVTLCHTACAERFGLQGFGRDGKLHIALQGRFCARTPHRF